MAKGWIEKLESVDRRAIFLIMGFAITVPLLFPVPLPVKPTTPVREFYEFVGAIPPGSRVLVADDWDPSGKAELQTISLLVHRQLRDRGIRVIDVCLWPGGPGIVAATLDEIYGKAGKTYGKDYIFLGFKDGREVVMASMGNSIPATYPADSLGRPLGRFPIMEGVGRISDLAALISISSGYPGTKEWVQQIKNRYNIPMVSATNGVSAPEYFAYYESKQLSGLIGGMKAFAEYEKLLGGDTGFATTAMTAQASGHYMLVILVIAGNVLYLLRRKMPYAALLLGLAAAIYYAAALWAVLFANGGS